MSVVPSRMAEVILMMLVLTMHGIMMQMMVMNGDEEEIQGHGPCCVFAVTTAISHLKSPVLLNIAVLRLWDSLL